MADRSSKPKQPADLNKLAASIVDQTVSPETAVLTEQLDDEKEALKPSSTARQPVRKK